MRRRKPLVKKLERFVKFKPQTTLARDHPADGKLMPSRASRSRFQSNPPEKPPIFLFAASTRWQGTKTGIGFAPHAPPTARTALGLPMARAISP